jgi:hypothetical protein
MCECFIRVQRGDYCAGPLLDRSIVAESLDFVMVFSSILTIIYIVVYMVHENSSLHVGCSGSAH